MYSNGTKSYPRNLRPCERRLNPLPLEKFTRHDGVLTAFVSDFGKRINDPGYFNSHPQLRNQPWFLEQMFDDSCDVGIAIKSHKTGREVRFVWVESAGRHHDYTGGYREWVFRAYEKDQPIAEVKIFND